MPDPLTTEEIARWRELDAKATEGPWKVVRPDSGGYCDVVWVIDESIICSAFATHAALIAEYRTALPRALDRIDELEALKLALRQIADGHMDAAKLARRILKKAGLWKAQDDG
jgi:hypothetical protein